MLSPVEQTLHTLLPTTNVLPPQLVTVANSLLAQSKHAASTLKPDEEIARIYACCHLACQRLINKCNLDIGKVVPPCAPRVYKKLYGFLDDILTAGKSSLDHPPAAQAPVINTSERKRKALSTREQLPTATPRSAVKTTKKRAVEESNGQGVPEEVAQLGRHLCRALKVSTLTPHVYTGLEQAFREIEVPESAAENESTSKRSRKLTAKAEQLSKSSKITVEQEKVPLLVLAVFQTALEKSRSIEIELSEGETIFNETISLLRDQDDVLAEKVYDNQYERIADEIAFLKRRLAGTGFWQSWIQNVPTISHAEDEPEAAEQEDMIPDDQLNISLLRKAGQDFDEDEEETPGAAGLLPGLGTMFQPAVDWLSEDRVQHFNNWKADMLVKIAEIEQHN